jgi:hypothetical protein
MSEFDDFLQKVVWQICINGIIPLTTFDQMNLAFLQVLQTRYLFW